MEQTRNNADIRDWLRGYRSTARNLENHIKQYERVRLKMDRYDKAFSKATNATQNWSGIFPQKRWYCDERADAILELIEAKAAAGRDDFNSYFDWLMDDLAALAASGREILAAISSLDNADHKDALFRRYICGDTWEKISLDMSVSVDTVYKWHGHALEELKQKGVHQHSKHQEPQTVHQ